MSDLSINRDRRIQGKHVLWGIIGFFAVVFCANFTFITLALQSWTGVSHDDAYSAGLAYNKTLQTAADQAARGWHSALEHSDGHIILRVRDAAGMPVDGLEITAGLERPTHHQDDRSLAFVSRTGGVYVADGQDLAQGQWLLQLTASH